MKLTAKDFSKLIAVRRAAEDPKCWCWDPNRGLGVLGKQRFDEIVKNAGHGPSGTRVLGFTKAEVSAIRAKEAWQEIGLAYEVKLIYEIWGVEKDGVALYLGRHGSLSKPRDRLPLRYVQSVAAKLGYGSDLLCEQNPASGVWHLLGAFEPPAGN